MSSWKCVKAQKRTTEFKVGDVLFGTDLLNGFFKVVQTHRRMSGSITVECGELMPIEGELWSWEEIK